MNGDRGANVQKRSILPPSGKREWPCERQHEMIEILVPSPLEVDSVASRAPPWLMGKPLREGGLREELMWSDIYGKPTRGNHWAQW